MSPPRAAASREELAGGGYRVGVSLPAGTIDLGELPRGGPREVAAPWPVLARLARRHDRRLAIRLAGAAATTALALLTLTAAAGPVRPVFVPMLTLQTTGHYVDPEHLYVIEAPRSGSGDASLAAYRLADGTVRWSVPAPAGEAVELQLHEQVLLATSQSAGQLVSTAFDPGTGRRLWRRDLGLGYPAPLADGYYLFQEDRFTGDQPGYRLTAVDPVTGEPVWTGSVSGRSYDLSATHLVVLDQDRLVSYRLATGERSATVTHPHGPSSDLQVTDGLAVVVDRWDRTPVLTGYDLATLRPQWTVRDLPGPDASVGPTRCGRLVCLAGPRPRVIDRTTGETVWSADWLPADPDSWYWVTDPELPGLAGRLLLLDVAGRRSGEPGHWLVDAGTGEPVLDLAGWQLEPGWGPTATESATPLLVRFVDQAALVGRLRPDLSGVTVLGAIDAAPPYWCRGLAEQVLCVAPAAGDRQPSELVLWGRR